MSEKVNVLRTFECDALDFLVASNAVIAERFGPDTILGSRRGWFWRRHPLTYQTIKVGVNEEVQVIGGHIEVRGFPGRIVLNPEGPMMAAAVPKDRRAEAELLLQAVHDRIKERSIYRGRAFNVLQDFLDLSTVHEEALTYNADLFRELDGNVWTLMDQREACRKAGTKLQRKVVFAGPHGSGKSLTAMLTAKKAVESGWTFVMVGSEMSSVKAVSIALDLARKYQPSIVLIEEFDQSAHEGDFHAVGRLMSVIEGAMNRTGELIVIMTTNYPEKIAASLQRPGRIDRIVYFDKFTVEDIGRLLKKVVPQTFLPGDIDWLAVGDACKSYTPAFVREVGNSAMLMAISEGKRQKVKPCVTQGLLVEAAAALKLQHEACSKRTLGLDIDRR